MSVITGTSGADTLTSSPAADSISAGAGNDSITWSNGGSDTIDGGDGADTLGVVETSLQRAVSISGVGGQTQVLDQGQPTDGGGGGASSFATSGPPAPLPPELLNISHVETLNVGLQAGGSVVVNSLTSSDLTTLNLQAAHFSSGSSEVFQINAGSAEGVLITETSPDSFSLTEGAATKSVTTNITSLTSADRIIINGSAGDDSLIGDFIGDRSASSPGLLVSGGDGNDRIGLAPFTTVHGDAGDDTFVWAGEVAPTHGSAIVDGGAGNDSLQFFTNMAARDLQLTSVGGGFLLKSLTNDTTVNAVNVENVFLGTEQVGSTFSVGDLTGSGIKHLTIALGPDDAFGGDPLNHVLLTATAGSDVINVGEDANANLFVTGLAESVSLLDAMAPRPGLGDVISINGGAGNDVIDAFTGRSEFVLIGGDGNDTLTGGFDHSTLSGGNGNDVLTGESSFGTVFDFQPGNTGFDIITGFKSTGSAPDVIQLDGFGFRNANNFPAFVLHNLVSDGHGGTDVITDNGFLIVDIKGVTLNQFSSANFLFD